MRGSLRCPFRPVRQYQSLRKWDGQVRFPRSPYLDLTTEEPRKFPLPAAIGNRAAPKHRLPMAENFNITGQFDINSSPEPKGLWVEQQLHEQFAQNYNSISSTLITFFVALLAIYGGVGYSLHELLSSPKENIFCFFAIAVIAAILVTFFIGYLCITQGYATRRDQFLAHLFRWKAYCEIVGTKQQEDDWTKAPHGYPEKYTPYGKNFFSYIPGIFINLLTACYLTIAILCGLYFVIWCNTEGIKGTLGLAWTVGSISGISFLVLCGLQGWHYKKYQAIKAQEEKALNREKGRIPSKAQPQMDANSPCNGIKIENLRNCTLHLNIQVNSKPKSSKK